MTSSQWIQSRHQLADSRSLVRIEGVETRTGKGAAACWPAIALLLTPGTIRVLAGGSLQE
jgi:hypothetical protein